MLPPSPRNSLHSLNTDRVRQSLEVEDNATRMKEAEGNDELLPFGQLRKTKTETVTSKKSGLEEISYESKEEMVKYDYKAYSRFRQFVF